MYFRKAVFPLISILAVLLLVVPISVKAGETFTDHKFLSMEYENTGKKVIQLCEESKIYNAKMEEVGVANEGSILIVKRIGDGLYEIEIDFLFDNIDEKLYLESPLFEEVELESIGNDKHSEYVLVDNALSFDGGVKLISTNEKNKATITIYSNVTFFEYYQLHEKRFVKWNGQYFNVFALKEDNKIETTFLNPNENSGNIMKKREKEKTADYILGTIEEVEAFDFRQREKEMTTLKTDSLKFSLSDKYFKVIEDHVTVYDNRGGTLRPVGQLTKGEIYPRISDYGNWHQIKFGNIYGYVWKAATIPASGNMIKNENNGLKSTVRSFSAKETLSVYDNSSGSLVLFGKINAGETYPILGTMGDWIRIDFAGRIGYVYAPAVSMEFVSSDKYFKVTEDHVTIYDNRGGTLRPVGQLTKGEVYPRISDYGNWHQIKFGNIYGYVWKAATIPASGNMIKNENNGLKSTVRSFSAKETLSVYDNSSGSLVLFGKINAGETYPILGTVGDWIQIDFAGRIGYVYAPAVSIVFLANDKYFKVVEEDVPIYINNNETSSIVGYLKKGQIFPRIKDYGDWHQIKFANGFGYVKKISTEPSFNNNIKNENNGERSSEQTFKTLRNIDVYDNSSGQLVSFAKIRSGEIYPIISKQGNWFKVDVAGRIGYVYWVDERFVQVEPIIKYVNTKYNLSLEHFLSLQMNAKPQTDLYRSLPAYVSKNYVKYLDDEEHPPGYYVTATALNVREAPNANVDTFIYGTLKFDTKITVLREVNGWYQISYSAWRNAKKEDTIKYLDPNLNSKYQHMRLDSFADISSKELNEILLGKGILEGKGQAFHEAAKKFNINEVYLISHSLLETGNGTSTLATGVPIKVSNDGIVTIIDPEKETPQ